ncbi:MAG: helix-turn-helix domain-containing protein [Planctomycetota bacterium]
MANQNAIETPSLPTVAERALAGLAELKGALEDQRPLNKQFTIRTIDLKLEPEGYTGEEIRHLRETLHVSQAVFAELLCVSVSTVRKWENDTRTPPKMARRLFDEIRADPSRWIDYLCNMVQAKSEIAGDLEAAPLFAH